jgi:ATP/maltotriose-dependent transcriptional regulator MalT/DNA-binding SARP family transcriptional activator
VRRLSAALDEGVVLLTAGPGYGKTTALEEALQGRGAVWVSCAGERDGGRLIVRLIQRLSDSNPGLADVLGERFAVSVQPVEALAIARELSLEFERLLVERLVLVFDDAEEMENAPTALGVVRVLLGAAAVGEKFSVAVASRRSLELRTAKLRASDALSEFGPADLGFSAEECGALLRLRTGAEPSLADVEAVMESTEGWPLGIALSAHGRQEPHRGTGDALFGYLAEEVLDQLDPELRAAAIDSSLARELTPSVVAALGLPESFSRDVQRAGLLLQQVDPETQAHRYHPLLREFLLERFHAERSPPEAARLHAAVAEALSAGGRQAEAVDHWLAAERWDEGIASMDAVAQQLLGSSPETVRGWLSRLPSEVRDEPAYRLLEGQLDWGAGRNERALPHLRDAVAGYRERGDLGREWLARWILQDALFALGKLDEMAALCEGWREPQVIEAAGPVVAGVGWHEAGLAAIRGDVEAATELADRLISDPAIGPLVRSLDCIIRAFVENPAGRGREALERYQQAISELEALDPLGRLPFVLAGAGLGYTELGELESALRMWERCVQEAERLGLGFMISQGHMQSALLHALHGRLDQAELELERGSGRGETGWRGEAIGHEARAAVVALQGDSGQALGEAEKALDLLVPAPIFFRVWGTCLTAPVLADSGAPERADAAVAEVLGALDAVFPGRKGRYHRAWLLAIRAWLSELAGDETGADEDLASAFLEAEGEVQHILRLEWPRLQRMVLRGLERGKLAPGAVIPALQRALPGGGALVPLLDHPLPEVRRAVVAPAAGSGDPRSLRRLEALRSDTDRQVAASAEAALERLRREPPPLRFELFGGFSVTRGTWRVDDSAWERRVAQRLVRLLLVNRDRAVSEDLIFEAFWPGKTAADARPSLQVAVSRARAVLDVPGAASVIEAAERAYRLRLRARDSVDVDEFARAATAALAEQGAGRHALLEHAASLWTGEPLSEERYSEWALFWRERLTELYLGVLEALAGSALESGDHVAAVTRARELVDVDPLNEGGHRSLMTAYARAGRRSQALRQFLACRRALVEELGVEPAAETSELQRRILAGEPV